jgi:ammonia channel protein AmtB
MLTRRLTYRCYWQDYRVEKKWSAVGFCSGAVSSLVAITPGSGFVGARECEINTHSDM